MIRMVSSCFAVFCACTLASDKFEKKSTFVNWSASAAVFSCSTVAERGLEKVVK